MKSNNLTNIKEQFPIFQTHPELVYLDNAATTQKPKSVLDAELNFYQTENANVYRGVYDLASQATNDYELARTKVQHFINAEKSAEVIFTKGTTQSINILAESLGDLLIHENDEIVVSRAEHHSNLVPWQEVVQRKKAKLVYVELDENGLIQPENLEKVLTNKTKIAALTHVSNVLGIINPIADLAKLAHQVGAVVAIDGAQGVGHIKVDVQELGVDFYSFSGHKMYGPTGIGVLYGKSALLNQMHPVEFGGEMINYVGDFETDFNELPYKFEGGTPNIAGAIGLGAAVDFINEIGIENIAQNEQDLLRYFRENLPSELGLTIYGQLANIHKTGIISFNLADIHPHDVATILDTKNIAIRAGHHCAQPLMRAEKVGSMCRVSFGLYNTTNDIDRLFTGITFVKEFFEND